jgi:uncharacterized phage-associated protein
MALTTARKVANYVLCFAREHGDLITNLKLQKLVYYSQAWFLALYDIPLFEGRLEAWVHGPVQPEVYKAFKQFGWNPITTRVTCPAFDDERIAAHLDEIMDIYGDLTGHHLERLVHQEDPWRKARGGLPPDAPSKATISDDDMRSFYRKMLDDQN